MMIIKTSAFGNFQEAFIEDRFKNQTNIIFSNDNNRGKTLMMQGLMHSLGYDSIFPTGFNYRSYYFYSKIEINSNSYEILRKGNSILLLENDVLNVFNSINEYKYYFDSNIYTLPRIEKDGVIKPVDLSMFYELFFLGQDNRNTSNLLIRGRNNKQDFKNMVYSMFGISITSEHKYDIDELKDSKKDINHIIRQEKKKLELLKKNPQIASFISNAGNNIEFEVISKRLKELHVNISELKKQRNREENRKAKLESLVYELNSLNRNLKEGKVKCSECGSSKIIFANQEFEFDVSNNYVRKNILRSIQENIIAKSETVLELNDLIVAEQDEITKILDTTTPDEQNYILFKDQILDSTEIDKVVYNLQKDISEIDKKIKNSESKIVSNKEKQTDVLAQILSEMKSLYSRIDPEGILVFEDLFTKTGQTYSGSEGQEFYFCKMLALNNVLKHQFPIIVDSFREGELSSRKENLMIDEFVKLNKQTILTSTLKDEEYDSDKYLHLKDINVIDYSDIEDSKILNTADLKAFADLLSKFGIVSDN